MTKVRNEGSRGGASVEWQRYRRTVTADALEAGMKGGGVRRAQRVPTIACSEGDGQNPGPWGGGTGLGGRTLWSEGLGRGPGLKHELKRAFWGERGHLGKAAMSGHHG